MNPAPPVSKTRTLKPPKTEAPEDETPQTWVHVAQSYCIFSYLFDPDHTIAHRRRNIRATIPNRAEAEARLPFLII
jgi:hypothetical protein